MNLLKLSLAAIPAAAGLWERNAPDRAVYAHALARWDRDLAEAQGWFEAHLKPG